MSRRRGRARRAPSRRRLRGPSPVAQLITLTVALVVILAFQDDIAQGAAGCFGRIASVDDNAPPQIVAPDAGPTAAPSPATPPSVNPAVEVRVLNVGSSPDAGSVDQRASVPDTAPERPSTAPDRGVAEGAGQAVDADR